MKYAQIASAVIVAVSVAHAAPQLFRRDQVSQPCIQLASGRCLSAWNCLLNGQDQGQITIDKGHSDGDALASCNQVQTSCAGNCTAEIATSVKVRYSDVIGDICTINDRYEPTQCSCPAGAVAVSGRCEKGDNCKYFTWRCASLQDEFNAVFQVSTELAGDSVFTDGSGPASCPPGTVGTYINCQGHNCDRMNLRCVAASVQLAGQTIPVEFSGDCTWTPWFTNGGDPNTGTCPQGTFIRGMNAKGAHSSELSLSCCSASYKMPILVASTTTTSAAPSTPPATTSESIPTTSTNPDHPSSVSALEYQSVAPEVPGGRCHLQYGDTLPPTPTPPVGKCSAKADCAADMCCSEHGYCGTGADYCNDKQKP